MAASGAGILFLPSPFPAATCAAGIPPPRCRRYSGRMQLPTTIKALAPADVAVLEAMSTLFGEAFAEPETYCGARPGRAYLRRLLAKRDFIALAALDGDRAVGGLAAYLLEKFEQERSEIYIYDLAVAASHRRRGIATALIEALRRLAAERGACLIYVQADLEDEAAIALYARFGMRADVLHFDIEID